MSGARCQGRPGVSSAIAVWPSVSPVITLCAYPFIRSVTETRILGHGLGQSAFRMSPPCFLLRFRSKSRDRNEIAARVNSACNVGNCGAELPLAGGDTGTVVVTLTVFSALLSSKMAMVGSLGTWNDTKQEVALTLNGVMGFQLPLANMNGATA